MKPLRQTNPGTHTLWCAKCGAAVIPNIQTSLDDREYVHEFRTPFKHTVEVKKVWLKACY